jgi:hypothetical protein
VRVCVCVCVCVCVYVCNARGKKLQHVFQFFYLQPQQGLSALVRPQARSEA